MQNQIIVEKTLFFRIFITLFFNLDESECIFTIFNYTFIQT
jgi:hypothetical protein